MIKKFIKISSIIILLFVLIIFYLSLVGVKTKKFNEKIVNKIIKINKRVKLDLKDVKFLLDPYNFTVSVVTKDPTVLLEGNKIEIEEIKTNISLKSLIANEFLIDDLELSTRSIKLNDIILLAKSFKSSTELFLLDRMIKEGFLKAVIKLQFDDKGNIKKIIKSQGLLKMSN